MYIVCTQKKQRSSSMIKYIQEKNSLVHFFFLFLVEHNLNFSSIAIQPSIFSTFQDIHEEYKKKYYDKQVSYIYLGNDNIFHITIHLVSSHIPNISNIKRKLCLKSFSVWSSDARHKWKSWNASQNPKRNERLPLLIFSKSTCVLCIV